MLYRIIHFTLYYAFTLPNNYYLNTLAYSYIMCITKPGDNVNPGQYNQLKLFEIIVGEIFSDPKDLINKISIRYDTKSIFFIRHIRLKIC